ncbi:Ig-like domain-containing protein [Nocardia cyriacigeorgica]|uniref:Ig-like domain-containing protein n=1 Tax=Nocardia cyriacigeorgica TaxID=135487 RepID=A0A6P1CQA2_9NOCA|nr:Ig-like domain-containing protein [Nocardia cyriacigeorgica]NEW33843.1 Ig-like domain-containing protein [Nocardia cyriacigeorgica]
MAPTTFQALKAKNDPLVVAALDWAVLLHDWASGASYMPADLTDGSGVLQSLPAGWQPSGELQKQAGVNLTPDTQTSNIEGYGSPGPRRTIVTSEGFTIDYLAQEWRKINLAMWHNTDLSAVSAAAGKGFKARKTSQLSVRYYSAILIGYDGSPGQELFPFFMYPKVAVTGRQAMAGQQGSELGLPMTLTVFDDSEYGSMYDFGVAGAGFDAIALDAGFATAPSSITVNPATASLAVGELIQLTVIDSNGVNRTGDCTFESANTAVATVSASGLVTGVAAGGPASVTAELGALSDTCAVTVV